MEPSVFCLAVFPLSILVCITHTGIITTTAKMWMIQSTVVSLALLSGAVAVAVDAPFSNYQTKINA